MSAGSARDAAESDVTPPQCKQYWGVACSNAERNIVFQHFLLQDDAELFVATPASQMPLRFLPDVFQMPPRFLLSITVWGLAPASRF